MNFIPLLPLAPLVYSTFPFLSEQYVRKLNEEKKQLSKAENAAILQL